MFGRGGDIDRIVDFGNGADRLQIDAGLVGDARDGAGIVDRFATQTSQGIVLQFGDGDRILLEDLTSMSDLGQNIDII